MIVITEVRNAQSISADNTAFDVEINHPEHGWIPYTLRNTDTDTTINNDDLLRLIGPHFEFYVAPTQEEIDAELAANIREHRDYRLVREVDPMVTNPLRWAELTESKQAEWIQYRTDLLGLTEQSGFPHEITWPNKPE